MEMNRIAFAFDIAKHSSVVCGIRKQKKDVAYCNVRNEACY